jgi:hypothetical protein
MNVIISIDLRNRETDLSLLKPNTDFGKRYFKYKGAVVWNNLPYEVKVSESFEELLTRQTFKIGSSCSSLFFFVFLYNLAMLVSVYSF